MGRHPDHEAVRREVRRWYTESTPEIGLTIVAERYGFLTGGASTGYRRLLMTVESTEAVAPALDSATEFFGSSAFEVWVDDRLRADRLTGALGASGWEPGLATTTLALVGPVRAGRRNPDVALEDVTSVHQLEEWSATKIRGFADDETPPPAEQVAGEVAGRRAEWPVCRYQLARLDGDPVAVLGHYTGSDQMVFTLATRVPFRHRGIAQTLLARWSEETDDPPVRSRLINCDDGGRPEALYRRLGFTDEVWWYRRYRRPR